MEILWNFVSPKKWEPCFPLSILGFLIKMNIRWRIGCVIFVFEGRLSYIFYCEKVKYPRMCNLIPESWKREDMKIN